MFCDLGDFQSARADIDVIHKYDPYKGRIEYGRISKSEGDLERASKHVETAINLRPTAPNAYQERAGLHYARGDVDKALTDISKCITSASDREAESAYELRAKWLCELKKYNEAAADFTAAIRCHHAYMNMLSADAGDLPTTYFDTNNLVSRADCYLQLHKPDEAIADLTKVIDAGNASARVHYNRGVAYEWKGEDVRAGVDYQRARELDPKFDDMIRANQPAGRTEPKESPR